jgi:hypothetical protein
MQVEARRINRNTYDLFFGKGWDNHTRVKQGKMSTYRVGGNHISKPELKDLHDVLAWNMPITYGQTVDEMLNNVLAIGD